MIGRDEGRYPTEEPLRALEELERVLRRHDWFYEMADSYSVWERGRRERREVEGRLVVCGRRWPETVRALVEEHVPRVFRETMLQIAGLGKEREEVVEGREVDWESEEGVAEETFGATCG